MYVSSERTHRLTDWGQEGTGQALVSPRSRERLQKRVPGSYHSDSPGGGAAGRVPVPAPVVVGWESMDGSRYNTHSN